MSNTPFSRNQERPAWLVLRVDAENLHRASLEQLDEMWGIYERACAQFPERHVQLVRLWGKPVAVAVIVDGRLALTRTVGFTGEIRADYERIQRENPGADVRMVEVFGKRAMRVEVLGEKQPHGVPEDFRIPEAAADAPVPDEALGLMTGDATPMAQPIESDHEPLS